ncbi:hypothetical protein ABVK25_010823 [Lepraria finkii]|uniref:Uncharacterized protein n=1 Tax=Lepraria finkii TaxID=1340010 RepID=A0ABR4AU18_9LECA
MRYIDRKVLTDMLRAMFGTDYELEDRKDTYVLTAPRKLSEAEINDLQSASSKEDASTRRP